MSLREITVQSTRESSSVKNELLGAVASTEDGREFRYVKAGATELAPGLVVANADEVANHKNIAVAAAASVGDTEISVTLGATAATADQYEDGFVTVNDADGEGITYRISGHPAIASAGTGTIVLDEPLRVALTTSSQVSLSSPYSGVVVAPVDQADVAVGVPNVTIAANGYGWVQTKGVCAVLADEAVTKGLALTLGTGVAGAVEAVDLLGEQVVGYALNALVDTEYQPVDLRIS